MRTRIEAPNGKSLDAILGSVVSVRILRILSDGDAHAPPYLAHNSNTSRPAIRESLIRLEREQMIRRVGEGRSILYRLNEEHPLARRIVKLFRAEAKWRGQKGETDGERSKRDD